MRVSSPVAYLARGLLMPSRLCRPNGADLQGMLGKESCAQCQGEWDNSARSREDRMQGIISPKNANIGRLCEP
jgi:hypothetical protein